MQSVSMKGCRVIKLDQLDMIRFQRRRTHHVAHMSQLRHFIGLVMSKLLPQNAGSRCVVRSFPCSKPDVHEDSARHLHLHLQCRTPSWPVNVEPDLPFLVKHPKPQCSLPVPTMSTQTHQHALPCSQQSMPLKIRGSTNSKLNWPVALRSRSAAPNDTVAMPHLHECMETKHESRRLTSFATQVAVWSSKLHLPSAQSTCSTKPRPCCQRVFSVRGCFNSSREDPLSSSTLATSGVSVLIFLCFHVQDVSIDLMRSTCEQSSLQSTCTPTGDQASHSHVETWQEDHLLSIKASVIKPLTLRSAPFWKSTRH